MIIEYPTEVENQPTGPPDVTHVDNTRYRVDISRVVPNKSQAHFSNFGYSTVVVKATEQTDRNNVTRYYVLVSVSEVVMLKLVASVIS